MKLLNKKIKIRKFFLKLFIVFFAVILSAFVFYAKNNVKAVDHLTVDGNCTFCPTWGTDPKYGLENPTNLGSMANALVYCKTSAGVSVPIEGATLSYNFTKFNKETDKVFANTNILTGIKTDNRGVSSLANEQFVNFNSSTHNGWIYYPEMKVQLENVPSTSFTVNNKKYIITNTNTTLPGCNTGSLLPRLSPISNNNLFNDSYDRARPACVFDKNQNKFICKTFSNLLSWYDTKDSNGHYANQLFAYTINAKSQTPECIVNDVNSVNKPYIYTSVPIIGFLRTYYNYMYWAVEGRKPKYCTLDNATECVKRWFSASNGTNSSDYDTNLAANVWKVLSGYNKDDPNPYNSGIYSGIIDSPNDLAHTDGSHTIATTPLKLVSPHYISSIINKSFQFNYNGTIYNLKYDFTDNINLMSGYSNNKIQRTNYNNKYDPNQNFNLNVQVLLNGQLVTINVLAKNNYINYNNQPPLDSNLEAVTAIKADAPFDAPDGQESYLKAKNLVPKFELKCEEQGNYTCNIFNPKPLDLSKLTVGDTILFNADSLNYSGKFNWCKEKIDSAGNVSKRWCVSDTGDNYLNCNSADQKECNITFDQQGNYKVYVLLDNDVKYVPQNSCSANSGGTIVVGGVKCLEIFPTLDGTSKNGYITINPGTSMKFGANIGGIGNAGTYNWKVLDQTGNVKWQGKGNTFDWTRPKNDADRFSDDLNKYYIQMMTDLEINSGATSPQNNCILPVIYNKEASYPDVVCKNLEVYDQNNTKIDIDTSSGTRKIKVSAGQKLKFVSKTNPDNANPSSTYYKWYKNNQLIDVGKSTEYYADVYPWTNGGPTTIWEDSSLNKIYFLNKNYLWILNASTSTYENGGKPYNVKTDNIISGGLGLFDGNSISAGSSGLNTNNNSNTGICNGQSCGIFSANNISGNFNAKASLQKNISNNGFYGFNFWDSNGPAAAWPNIDAKRIGICNKGICWILDQSNANYINNGNPGWIPGPGDSIAYDYGPTAGYQNPITKNRVICNRDKCRKIDSNNVQTDGVIQTYMLSAKVQPAKTGYLSNSSEFYYVPVANDFTTNLEIRTKVDEPDTGLNPNCKVTLEQNLVNCKNLVVDGKTLTDTTTSLKVTSNSTHTISSVIEPANPSGNPKYTWDKNGTLDTSSTDLNYTYKAPSTTDYAKDTISFKINDQNQSNCNVIFEKLKDIPDCSKTPDIPDCKLQCPPDESTENCKNEPGNQAGSVRIYDSESSFDFAGDVKTEQSAESKCYWPNTSLLIKSNPFIPFGTESNNDNPYYCNGGTNYTSTGMSCVSKVFCASSDRLLIENKKLPRDHNPFRLEIYAKATDYNSFSNVDDIEKVYFAIASRTSDLQPSKNSSNKVLSFDKSNVNLSPVTGSLGNNFTQFELDFLSGFGNFSDSFVSASSDTAYAPKVTVQSDRLVFDWDKIQYTGLGGLGEGEFKNIFIHVHPKDSVLQKNINVDYLLTKNGIYDYTEVPNVINVANINSNIKNVYNTFVGQFQIRQFYNSQEKLCSTIMKGSNSCESVKNNISVFRCDKDYAPAKDLFNNIDSLSITPITWADSCTTFKTNYATSIASYNDLNLKIANIDTQIATLKAKDCKGDTNCENATKSSIDQLELTKASYVTSRDNANNTANSYLSYIALIDARFKQLPAYYNFIQDLKNNMIVPGTVNNWVKINNKGDPCKLTTTGWNCLTNGGTAEALLIFDTKAPNATEISFARYPDGLVPQADKLSMKIKKINDPGGSGMRGFGNRFAIICNEDGTTCTGSENTPTLLFKANPFALNYSDTAGNNYRASNGLFENYPYFFTDKSNAFLNVASKTPALESRNPWTNKDKTSPELVTMQTITVPKGGQTVFGGISLYDYAGNNADLKFTDFKISSPWIKTSLGDVYSFGGKNSTGTNAGFDITLGTYVDPNSPAVKHANDIATDNSIENLFVNSSFANQKSTISSFFLMNGQNNIGLSGGFGGQIRGFTGNFDTNQNSNSLMKLLNYDDYNNTSRFISCFDPDKANSDPNCAQNSAFANAKVSSGADVNWYFKVFEMLEEAAKDNCRTDNTCKWYEEVKENDNTIQGFDLQTEISNPSADIKFFRLNSPASTGGNGKNYTLKAGTKCVGKNAIFLNADGATITIENDLTTSSNKDICLFIVQSGTIIIKDDPYKQTQKIGATNSIDISGGIIDLVEASFIMESDQATFIVDRSVELDEDTTKKPSQRYDRLIIRGFVFSTAKAGKVNSTNETIKPLQFNRNLALGDNDIFPAEWIIYDPRALDLFRNVVGFQKKDDWVCTGEINLPECKSDFWK